MQLSDALSLLTAQHDEIEALLVEVSSATSPATRTSALAELTDKLTLHLAIEQELLYPVADPLISREVRAEVLAEHQEIKRVLADLIWLELEDQQFGRKLVSLQKLLLWHETWQEAELFERLAAGLPAPRLDALGVEVNGWLDRQQLATAA